MAEAAAEGGSGEANASGRAEGEGAPYEKILKAKMLDAALEAVPQHGWTVGALSAGAVACGLSPAAHGMATRGPIELVRHFNLKCDEALREELAAQRTQMEALEVQNRLVLAMQIRLRMMEPYVDNWPQALALKVLPTNLAESLGDAHALAALLLNACGERALSPLAPEKVDVKMKRMSIGAIYGAAELYMLTDRSPGLSDTWLFLEREVEAVHQLAVAGEQLSALSPSSLLMSLLSRR